MKLLQNLIVKDKKGNDILNANVFKDFLLDYIHFTKNKHAIRAEQHGFFGHFVEFIDIPLHWMRKLTIPPCDEEKYNHFYTVIWPFFGLTFLVYNFF